MTIEDGDKVDGVGIDKKTKEVVLLISDHITWDDEQAHAILLEAKISGYLTFMNSGQIAEVLPQAKGLPVRIELVHEHEPTLLATRFLESAKRQLREVGITFSYGALPKPY